MSYPIYILELGNETRIVFPDGKADLGHTDFWEQVVAAIVARHFGIPLRKLVDLPYCQKRARIVGKTVYYGEKHGKKLLTLIRKVTGNKELTFAFDDHEQRLEYDVAAFELLVKRSEPRGSKKA